MKRTILGIVLVACAVLLSGAAPAKMTAAKPAVAPGEEYHHLLMLDVREAVQHAKTLHHYAQAHARHLDKGVVMKHVDELSKNLEGVRTNLTDLAQNVGTKDKEATDEHLAAIRADQEKASGELDLLKAEAAKEAPDASLIVAKSKAIYTAMSSADTRHRKTMAKHGIHEPAAPAKG
jgi:hypothetical protein